MSWGINSGWANGTADELFTFGWLTGGAAAPYSSTNLSGDAFRSYIGVEPPWDPHIGRSTKRAFSPRERVLTTRGVAARKSNHSRYS